MAEQITTDFKAESHLILDQPLLRMPYELSRNIFKKAQRITENEYKKVSEDLKATTAAAGAAATDPSTTIQSLDAMVARMTTLKRKLESLRAEDEAIHLSARARIAHLQDLYTIQSLEDVKYESWSRTRLDRLLVDYMLRSGYSDSAKLLAKEKEVEQLVDVDAFEQCGRIEKGLRKGEIKEALAWCADNRQALRKMNNALESELRLQQYIELVRSGNQQRLAEATQHARKYLAPHQDTNFAIQAAGLLAFSPETVAEPYRALYSQDRYTNLASLFLTTHHSLYSLPSRPLLHIALSAGLSALKTPSCHSHYTSSSSNSNSTSTSVCPICSTELNELARNVPYAHHTKSYVESDPVVLPNGRIYGRERLMKFQEKVGTEEGKIRDPTVATEVFEEGSIKKVFIS